MKHLAIIFVQVYRLLISPFSPPSCRYIPTCSQYTIDALHKYGFVKGCTLAIKRLFRCHPWGGQGHDPIE